MNHYPLIDFHTHFHTDVGLIDTYVKAMEVNKVKKVVSLSMPFPVVRTNAALAFCAKMKYPEKFIVFTAIDYRDIASKSFKETAIYRLVEEATNGAQGLKLHVPNGVFMIHPNDSRLQAIYKKAGELSMPVLIHMNLGEDRENAGVLADKGLYFPADVQYKELKMMLKNNRKTNFVIAHLAACLNKKKLDRFARLFEDNDNLYADISATFLFYVMLKKPQEYREFIVTHADRILFGTDLDLSAPFDREKLLRFYNDAYQLSRAFISHEGKFSFSSALRKRRREWMHETQEWEKIDHFEGEFVGMNLPPDVLKKVYYQNAEKLLGPAKSIGRNSVIKKAKEFRADLLRARTLSPTKSAEYSEYFVDPYRYSRPFFESIAKEQGKAGLSTAVSDKWSFSEEHTTRAIALLVKTLGS